MTFAGVGQQKLALLADLGEVAEELRAGSVKGGHGVETSITDRLCGRALGQDGSRVARHQRSDGRASATQYLARLDDQRDGKLIQVRVGHDERIKMALCGTPAPSHRVRPGPLAVQLRSSRHT